jgi:protein gp37
MSLSTTIQWTDASLNPWMGCTPVSEGCANCYAKTATPVRVFDVKWGKGCPRRPVSTFREQALALNRKGFQQGRRFRVFPSLCDWLDPEVPASMLSDFLAVVRATEYLDWQLLSKRPECFRDRLEAAMEATIGMPDLEDWIYAWLGQRETRTTRLVNPVPPANVWVGTSIENALVANPRYKALIEIAAAVRFLSLEPLLGNIVLPLNCTRHLDWVIVGGESGKNARPCAIQWIESIVKQCWMNAIPCFVKQIGAKPFSAPEHDGATGYEIPVKHPKGGDPAEWPEYLRVRQFPVRFPKTGEPAKHSLQGVGVLTSSASNRSTGRPSGKRGGK